MGSNIQNKDDLSPEKVERKVERRTREYEVLHEITQTLQKSGDLKILLENVLTTLIEFEELAVEHKAGIFIANQEEKVLQLFCTVGKFSEEFLQKEKVIPYGACLCGRVALSGELLTSNSCFSDARHEHKFENMTAHGHYIVPLKSDEQVIGVLFLYTDENPPWHLRNQEILISICGLIAGSIVAHKREQEIKEKNDALEELNELKNKFLGIASHDLRNPLYLIKTFSEVMRDGAMGKVTEKQEDGLQKIYNASLFMQGLLENLLDISQIESGKIEINKEPQELNEVVKQQAEMAQLLADKKDIQVHFDPGDLPLVHFDTRAINQVLGNFIGNAVKFSPLGSKILVTTEKLESSVRLSVHDDGPGLSKEDQQLLFKEFQTLTARPTGGEKSTGLGLAICEKLIHLHDGKVGVASELGKGSTFYFLLPC
jgi:signal transduction histidine kinase